MQRFEPSRLGEDEHVLTPYILIAVALVLLLATALRRMRHGAVGPQGRTWLLVAAIFGVVSAWLLVSP